MDKRLYYYKNLDGLRGIAAIMVVIFHFFTYPISQDYLYLNTIRKITEFGQHGVSLFFVLSGFVITRILFDTKHNHKYFKNFYIRRVLRIFPLYYLALIIWYYIMPLIMKSYTYVDISSQTVYYFYLQNIVQYIGIGSSGPPHFWSLAVEEHFYLIWPLLIYLVPINKFKYLFWISIVLLMIIKVTMIFNNLSINKFTFTRIDQIIFGSFLAYLERKGKLMNLTLYLRTGLLTLLFGIMVYFLQKIVPNIYLFSKYYILGLFFFSIIGLLLSLKESSYINKLLSNNIFQFLGKISYGIYVWHIFVLIIQNRYFSFNYLLLDLFITLSISVLISYISFKYWENYFIKLKGKFSY